jgi:general stress protein 26
MDTLNGAEARETIWSLIKDIRVAQLATTDESGRIFHARPMIAQNMKESQKEFDGTLWFFTRSDSRKAHEIEHNSHALLTYADNGKQAYVSVSGQASIERNHAIIDEYWNDANKAWFPEGKDDPSLVLIRFEAEDAEFWHGPGPVIMGLAYLKTLVTGDQPDVGKFGKANLQH